MQSVTLSALIRCFTVVLLFTIQIHAKKCITPNNEKAKCISLYRCPVLIQALATQTNESISFVRRSHCGTWNANADPKVCCGNTSMYRIPEKKTTENTTPIAPAPAPQVRKSTETPIPSVIKKPLSDKRFCGYQHTDDYFYTGNETSIDEFPWLAVFIYQLDDDLEEDIVDHADYIRPICLPMPGTVFAQPGELLTTTGFGQVTTDGAYTVIKKKIHTELITNEECDDFYSAVPGRFRNVTENVLCTLDLSNNTAYSCSGDSGAPVMLSRRAQWHMEGFAVWGTDNCGSDFPRVYTRVSNYLGWIEENVRPW